MKRIRLSDRERTLVRDIVRDVFHKEKGPLPTGLKRRLRQATIQGVRAIEETINQRRFRESLGKANQGSEIDREERETASHALAETTN